ncbi:MAG: membrane protein insertase YidC [Rickettsiales bacterium]|jgi:YidC/Oxa1 family membrane protein insertase|nr:membrane protein insertase YidC [Rickettsiales bacterium]
MVRYLDKKSGFNQWLSGRQSSEKKTSKFSSFFWWLIIFLLSWWLFSSWFAPSGKTDDNGQKADIVQSGEIPNIPVGMFEAKDSLIQGTVRGIRIESLRLANYKQSKDSKEEVCLLCGGGTEFIEIGLIANGTTAPNIGTDWNAPVNYNENYNRKLMAFKNADGIEFSREITAENYVINVRDTIRNTGKRDVSFTPYARIVRAGGESNAAVATGGIAYANSEIEREDWKDLEKKAHIYQTTNGFAGFADQYWETIAALSAPDQTIRIKKSDDRYQADASAAPVQVGAGKSVEIETRIFAGPRDQSILAAAAASIPGINQTMDYGWFWFLARPMLWGLNAIHGLVMNYGLAIILLTIVLRVLMWPLTRKSYTSMAAMQKMQPEMRRIQKLYANDKARMQMELMKLYQTHKTSPMSGCLPMLLQIPIFFALYKALLISVPMRQAGFLWISDLAVMDPFFILPIIMGATMWWQQKLQGSAPAADSDDPMAQTQKIMKWLPFIFTIMFVWMPAGLVLYWTVSNLFGIGQMYFIKKMSNK